MFAYSVKCRVLGFAAAVSLSVLALQGCSKKHASAHDGPIALGTYRATLKLPGGELPFGLEIARENERYVAYLVNGAERVRVPEVSVAGGRIEMLTPGFENRLSARIDDDELEGDVTVVKLDGKNQVIPFAAGYGVDYRFVEKPLTDNADISGRWAVTFTPDSGKPCAAVGEFAQTHSEVTGTFLTGTGDHRFLAGDVRDDEFFLSTFDGAHVYLYKGHIDGKGRMTGTYWSGLASREQFAGKVVIVALGGSWCPNCHDEAAFLAPYYVQNRDRGLEVVELMFEHFSDFAQAAAATQRCREKFDLRYATLIAGTSDKDEAAKRLPQLNGVFAFPTTVFLDRRGRVRRIYTGFSGPGTGDHYQKLIEDFDATVEQLLAETEENAADTQADGA